MANRKVEVLLLVKVTFGKNWNTTNRNAGFIPSNVLMFSELHDEFASKIRMTAPCFSLCKDKNRKQERVHIIIKNLSGLMGLSCMLKAPKHF